VEQLAVVCAYRSGQRLRAIESRARKEEHRKAKDEISRIPSVWGMDRLML